MKNKRIDEIDNDIIEEAEGSCNTDSLSAEELRVIKASIESARVDRSKLPPHDTSEKAGFFRFLKKNKLLAIVAVIIIVGLLGGTVFGCVFGIMQFIDNVIKPGAPFKIYIGEEDPYEVPLKDAIIDGVLYIDVKKVADHISEHTKLKTAFNGKRVQLSADTDTYILFENNSDFVYINGSYTTMEVKTFEGDRRTSAKAYISDSEWLVPYEFISDSISSDTIRFSLDSEDHIIEIKPRYTAPKNDPENKTMKEILFITEKLDVTEIPPEYVYVYTIDVTEYLENIKAEHLLLANKEKPLGSSFVPEDLTVLTCPTAPNRTFELDRDAALALHAMMLAMEKAGIKETYVTSAYRSYSYQEKLYQGYVDKHMGEGMSEEEAMKKASTYSARPGESEHQTGLCFDFTTKAMYGQLNEKFEKQEAFDWLVENAHMYGFILRYPKDKVDITGYDYEPWHYRFVGRQAATDMYYSGQCLEEYLEDKK